MSGIKIRKLSFRLGISFLMLFQMYIIITNWKDDFQTTLFAIIILVACVLLFLFDLFFIGNSND